MICFLSIKQSARRKNDQIDECEKRELAIVLFFIEQDLFIQHQKNPGQNYGDAFGKDRFTLTYIDVV